MTRTAIGIALLLAAAGCKKDQEYPPADPHLLAAATGFDVGWVAVYQNQEQVILDRGFGEHFGSRPPILAGRDMLVRVGVDPIDGTPSRNIGALLQVQQGNGGAINHFETGRTRRPNPDDFDTTFNFTIPGDQVKKGLKLEVSLRELGLMERSDNPKGRWIWTSDRLEVENTDFLDLVIVPIVVQDGQDYEPDTSPEQLALITEMVEAQYPIERVDITVTDAMTWLGDFSSGGHWGEILGRVTDRRESDEPARENTYYYGAIAPPDPYGNSGIAGLSNVAMSPGDSFARASVGWGYSGPESVDVLLHEVGHAHGRGHVNCGGADGADPSYPHDPNTIGIRAWDPVTETLIYPEDAADVMSYCSPAWVSDYTYEALHERTLALRGARSAKPRTLRRARVDETGTGPASGLSRAEATPAGEPVRVLPYDLDGRPMDVVEGWLYPYDHLDGGTVLFDGAELEVSRIVLVD